MLKLNLWEYYMLPSIKNTINNQKFRSINTDNLIKKYIHDFKQLFLQIWMNMQDFIMLPLVFNKIQV